MNSRLTLVTLIALTLAPGVSAIQKKSKPAAAVTAPSRPAFDLTIDSIMRGNGLYGYEPRAVRWAGDSQRIFFEWKAAADPREKEWETWQVNRDGSGLRKLSEEEAKVAPPADSGGFGGGGFFGGGRGGGMDRSRDGRWGVYSDSGDVVLYEVATAKRRKLTRTNDAETGPRFTRDGKGVTFTRGGNLFRLALDSGDIEQLTDIRTAGSGQTPGVPSGGPVGGFGMGRGAAAAAASGEPQKGTDSQEYLKKEEKELLDIVKRRAAQREEQAAKRKKQSDGERKPFTLQSRQSIAGLQLTPDGTRVIATLSDAAEGSKNSIVPNFVTESAYVEDIPARGMVGDTQARMRMAVIDVRSGEVTFVQTGLKPAVGTPSPRTGDAQNPKPSGETPETPDLSSHETGEAADAVESQGPPQGQTGAPQAGQSPRKPAPPAERDVTLSAPVWSEDGKRAVLIARSADFKDRWIMALDPQSGSCRLICNIHDDAWVGPIGGGNLGWLKDDKSVYFQSEKTGYSHLYAVSFDGGEPRALTSGNWEVLGATLTEDKTRFNLTTNEGSPFEVHYYSMPAEGGGRTRITSLPGHHSVTPSPDGQWLADVHSFSNRPPELFVLENKPGAESKRITTSPTAEFGNYPWIDPPIVEIPARDGIKVPARMYKPKDWKAGGPGVIFVHGAGYAQNVHRWWSSNSQVYLFNHLLMENGYLVLDLDYRGSAGYGRDWRTAIYRHMGGKDLDDQVDAAKWMAGEHGVDAKRIGIYGGSYGGFITLMAMFTAPDTFAAGAALRPVTDWAHYNHGYTGAILNLPQNDPEAYKRSSPVYFAQNLKGALLICHGMVDTNVFFQDSVRLAQRLIELRKENWELAVYPVEDHGFIEPTSWSDEYKRIFRLFETHLKAPAAPLGKGASRK